MKLRTVTRLAVGATIATVLATGLTVAAPLQETERAAELTDRAVELVNENRLGEALELLDQAIEVDDTYWQAYYQEGRIYGMREDFLMARDRLLKASELNPGHAHTHRLAWEAAYRLGDYENAWDQAIRASLAGVNMNQWFMEMYGKSDPPEDFEQRINAPRIFVADLEILDVEANAQLPFNRNPTTNGIGTISGRPAYAEGLNRANENAFNLKRVRDNTREALFRAPYLGSVLDLELADYILGISVEALGEGHPVWMEGYLRLYDTSTGEAVYFTSLKLRDISSDTVLFGEIERQIIELQKWTLDQNR
ncbi:MAG: tetratricopeptide repeat protein [Acidobacteriota bacterium]|jgi:tetratricopeptide (TPR) repeat protein